MFAGDPTLALQYPQRDCASTRRSPAILASVIFNALIIIALIPLAAAGRRWRPASAAAILRRTDLVWASIRVVGG